MDFLLFYNIFGKFSILSKNICDIINSSKLEVCCMNFSDIRPFVRYIEQIQVQPEDFQPASAAYDHVMLYVLDGTADLIIDSTVYPLEHGNVTIIKPASFYTFSNIQGLDLIWIHFDYDCNNAIESSFYLKPDTKEVYHYNKLPPRLTIADESIFNATISSPKHHHLEEYYKLLLSEFTRREKYFDISTCTLLTYILIDLSRHFQTDRKMKAMDETDTANAIIHYIHEHYHQDLTAEDIAREFDFHPKYIGTLVKNKTGYPIHKYILLRRVSKSIELLQNSNMCIYEIADKVGFSDVSHFSKCFKQMMGKSPRQFRGDAH